MAGKRGPSGSSLEGEGRRKKALWKRRRNVLLWERRSFTTREDAEDHPLRESNGREKKSI